MKDRNGRPQIEDGRVGLIGVLGSETRIVREMRRNCNAAVGFVVVVLSALIIRGAVAHDRERPDLDDWFGTLQNGKGPCCDGTDAKRVDDADWESRNGHYRVRINGEWVDVPEQAVVNGPNLAGRTMVWLYYLDGHPKPRCFMPGSMS
jgi:hypothetical protein